MPARSPAARPLARLVTAADFERVLATRSQAGSAHFAAHHVGGSPAMKAPASPALASPKLSTIGGQAIAQPVEDFSVEAPAARVWIGAVVPKRHARRAVTRTLIKRQIYAATARLLDRLAPGLWIVRLRAPFDRARFPSAASSALQREARSELEALLIAAAARRAP